eukprot:133231_1
MKLQHHAWPSSHPIVEAYLTQIIIIDIFAYNSEETILLMKPFLLVLLVLITANLFLTAGDTADESKHAYGRRGKGRQTWFHKRKTSWPTSSPTSKNCEEVQCEKCGDKGCVCIDPIYPSCCGINKSNCGGDFCEGGQCVH